MMSNWSGTEKADAESGGKSAINPFKATDVGSFLQGALRWKGASVSNTVGRSDEWCMPSIASILYPVDFSPSCIAMAPYVKRAAALLEARVSLVHVVDPTGYNGLQLYVRPISEVSGEHLAIGRDRLDSFLTAEFPAAQFPIILTSGDAATEIARVAREDRFDLIIIPTHSGTFRQMLLGSTTAKVINDADCPVLTSRHAQTIAPRPLEHREWLCADDAHLCQPLSGGDACIAAGS